MQMFEKYCVVINIEQTEINIKEIVVIKIFF